MPLSFISLYLNFPDAITSTNKRTLINAKQFLHIPSRFVSGTFNFCQSINRQHLQDLLQLSHYTPQGVRGNTHCSYSFSTSALDGSEWSASRPCHALSPGKGPPGTHCTGGWVGPRAGLDTEARGKVLSPLPGIEHRSPGHQSVVRHYTY
jgi:hypothetical protein